MLSRKLRFIFFIFLFSRTVYCDEPIITQIYHQIPTGAPNEKRIKDFYINLGRRSGATNGANITVFRLVSNFHGKDKAFIGDVLFPYALLKIIHADRDQSIARLERFLPNDSTPLLDPAGIAIGDPVRLGQWISSED